MKDPWGEMPMPGEEPVPEIQAPDPAAAAQPFVLTPENYYSDQANKLYLSNSLFKALYGWPASPNPCEAAALFDKSEERSEALLIGGYVDAAFESDQALEDYKARYKDSLIMKSGKAPYKFVKDADIAIARARQDKIFMSYLSGQHQVVETGIIAGQPFKIKMDDYVTNTRITDLKYVKSAAEVYNEPLRRRVTFIEAYGYHIQGAIYQEVMAQKTGRRLPFFISYITKEEIPDFDVVEIPQEMLDEGLEFVKLSLAARPVAEIMAGPKPCKRRSCAWCRSQKVLTGPMPYVDFMAYAQT